MLSNKPFDGTGGGNEGGFAPGGYRTCSSFQPRVALFSFAIRAGGGISLRVSAEWDVAGNVVRGNVSDRDVDVGRG